ncbi:MAG: class I SAM-dependent methyltransferase [Acidiferrobacterales bacterium]
MAIFSHEQARAFYDRFGSRQDWQRFYEDRAIADLIAQLSLQDSRAVFEFGCGTGRLAEMLLEYELSSTARYVGVDVSATMVALARQRLERFAPRARVLQTGGETTLDLEADSFDRFLSAYVLDLLALDDIHTLIDEAHRVLVPGGLLGVVSLTHGTGLFARLVEKVWTTVHALHPALVGGCRPISLGGLVGGAQWQIRHRRNVTQLGIASEVIIAAKRPA